MLVSHMQTLQPSAWIFSFSHFVAAQDALQTQHVTLLRLGMRLNISYLCGAFRNSWDKFY